MIETSHRDFFFTQKSIQDFFLHLRDKTMKACAVASSWQASWEPLRELFHCRTKGSVTKHNCPCYLRVIFTEAGNNGNYSRIDGILFFGVPCFLHVTVVLVILNSKRCKINKAIVYLSIVALYVLLCIW